jgi:hypothetical protein
MRNFVIATAAVALIGLAGTARAETVDLALADMETITAGAFMGPSGFSFDFSKHGRVDLQKYIDIYARFDVHPNIKGNYADGEAAATAYGKNTFTETLSFGDTVEGYMSRSGSHAVAASGPTYYHMPPRRCCGPD